MDQIEQKIVKSFTIASKIILITLMFILILIMILGTGDLIINLIQIITSSSPYYLTINIEELYAFFSILIIFIVGYELFKSMILVLQHDKIPVKSILQIAVITLANKMITLNIKTISLEVMIGICAIIFALSIVLNFYNKTSEKN